MKDAPRPRLRLSWALPFLAGSTGLAAISLLPAFLACGGNEPGGEAPTPDAAADAPADVTVGEDGDAPPPPPPRDAGVVLVGLVEAFSVLGSVPSDGGPGDEGGTFTVDGGGRPGRFTLAAAFGRDPFREDRQRRTFGSCVLDERESGAVTLDAGPLGIAPTATAGVLRVRGGTAPVDLAPGAPGSGAATTYASVTSTTTALWGGGESLTVFASGGAVPAFTLQLEAPVAPVLVAPSWGDDGVLQLPRDGGALDLRWQGVTRGNLVLTLRTPRTLLTCTFPPAAAATAQVPAAALQALPRGSYVASLEVRESSYATAETYEVTFTARSPLRTDAGVLTEGTATMP